MADDSRLIGGSADYGGPPNVENNSMDDQSSSTERRQRRKTKKTRRQWQHLASFGCNEFQMSGTEFGTEVANQLDKLKLEAETQPHLKPLGWSCVIPKRRTQKPPSYSLPWIHHLMEDNDTMVLQRTPERRLVVWANGRMYDPFFEKNQEQLDEYNEKKADGYYTSQIETDTLYEYVTYEEDSYDDYYNGERYHCSYMVPRTESVWVSVPRFYTVVKTKKRLVMVTVPTQSELKGLHQMMFDMPQLAGGIWVHPELTHRTELVNFFSRLRGVASLKCPSPAPELNLKFVDCHDYTCKYNLNLFWEYYIRDKTCPYVPTEMWQLILKLIQQIKYL